MAPTITKQKVLELVSKSTPLTIIDVRSEEEFDAQHIPNAINIPLDQLDVRSSAFSKDRKYITACGKGGGRSEKAANFLRLNGFNSVYLEGGTFGWFTD